jgi:hypothetical protein
MLNRLGNPWNWPFIGLFDQQTTALGVFLDIAGALSHTSFHPMCVVLVRHRVGYTTVGWIKPTMEGRIAMGTLGSLSRVLQCPGIVGREASCPRSCGATLLLIW